MSLEFKTDGTAIELGPDYKEIQCSWRIVGRRLYTNGRHAVEILAPGKKRDRLLTDYLAQQKPEPVATVATEPLRETVIPEEQVARIADVAPPVIQEQAEETPFIPDPNKDWFSCVLASRMPNSSVIIGELSNQQLVWIHERDVTVRVGGHSLCLIGASASVRMEPNIRNHRFQFRAIECQIEGEEKGTTRTTGEVTYWTGSLGAARMDCGCSIGVGTASRDDQLGLEIGDRIGFDIFFSEKLQNFIGRNITVLGTKE